MKSGIFLNTFSTLLEFGYGARFILDSYSGLTSDLTTNLSKRVNQEEVKAMCNDMRRYERMAEENRRREKEPKIDFIINEPERIALPPKTEPKKGQAETS
jgi:hypothetical protein